MGEGDIREIRINPIVPSESVLVATARGMRPKESEQTVARNTEKHVTKCPFCVGNEHLTPPTIIAHPDEKNWNIRIVENLYPVLGEDHSPSPFNFGLQQIIPGYGRHEVVIDHTDHGIAIHEMGADHLAALFSVYRDRIRQLFAGNARLQYVLVFKTMGTLPEQALRIPIAKLSRCRSCRKTSMRKSAAVWNSIVGTTIAYFARLSMKR